MKYFIFLFLLTASTCQEKKQTMSDEELSSLLNNSIIKYHETKEVKILEDAYEELEKNINYKKTELSASNSQLIIALLMNLKKYDELVKLLTRASNLNEYNRLNTLNIVRYLKLKTQTNKKPTLILKITL